MLVLVNALADGGEQLERVLFALLVRLGQVDYAIALRSRHAAVPLR